MHWLLASCVAGLLSAAAWGQAPSLPSGLLFNGDAPRAEGGSATLKIAVDALGVGASSGNPVLKLMAPKPPACPNSMILVWVNTGTWYGHDDTHTVVAKCVHLSDLADTK